MMLLSVGLFIFSVVRTSAFSFDTVRMEYHQLDTCGADMVLRAESRYKELAAESALHCGLLCRSHASCKSFDYDAGLKRCYLGSVAVDFSHCQQYMVADTHSGGGAQHFTQRGQCPDGLELETDSGTCQCPRAFAGTQCSHRMQDCTDWNTYTESNDVLWVWPLNVNTSFQVFCDKMTSKARTVLMKRKRGNLNFTQSWAQYTEGFGDVFGDHWLGLQYMHLFTINRRYQLKFSVQMINDPDSVYVVHSYVHIGNESTGFALTTTPMKNTNNTFIDCLSSPDLSPLPFSTSDLDNDLDDSKDCSRLFGGGWWFNGTAGCSLCNPTGRLVTSATGDSDEAFWATSEGNVVPKNIIMFLLPE